MSSAAIILSFSTVTAAAASPNQHSGRYEQLIKDQRSSERECNKRCQRQRQKDAPAECPSGLQARDAESEEHHKWYAPWWNTDESDHECESESLLLPPQIDVSSINQSGADAVAFSWTIPDDATDMVDGYRVYVDGELASELPVSKLAYVVSGLEIGHEYAIEVRATYGEYGESPAGVSQFTYQAVEQQATPSPAPPVDEQPAPAPPSAPEPPPAPEPTAEVVPPAPQPTAEGTSVAPPPEVIPTPPAPPPPPLAAETELPTVEAPVQAPSPEASPRAQASTPSPSATATASGVPVRAPSVDRPAQSPWIPIGAIGGGIVALIAAIALWRVIAKRRRDT